jgi:two-component system CheB/CheR fusion protein
MRILLVEDHSEIALSMARHLRAEGHDVCVAATAGAALGACGAGAFDLVISDIGLPDLDGWEMLRRLRGDCATPAIALTAYGGPEDVARSHAAGFDLHLTKPIDFKILTAAVARFDGDGGPPAGAA